MIDRYPHVIRLRGFWQREALEEANEGGGRFCRRFGAPTGLDYHERVWLVCEGIAAPATIELNGEPVGQTSAGGEDFACDVTGRLQSRNGVCLRLAAADATGPIEASEVVAEPARAVRLEIRTTYIPP